MIGNRFNYAFIDGSWVLTRNLWIATKDKKPGEMNPGDVCRITIQTIAKMYKDWECSADKPILIFDEWNKDINGYIRSWMIKDYVQYKGSRKWMTQQLLEEMKADPNVTPEEIEKAEHELAVNKCKFEAKKIMKEEFKKIGIPYFSYPGYEYDDIATLASFGLHGKSEKPNVIVTKDSDLSWSLCPSCVQFLPPVSGKEPRFITYEEMYKKVPQVLLDNGVSLYWYHAYCDSLGVTGHNDNLKTIKTGYDGTQAILEILRGDMSSLKNPDAFKAQMYSFDLSNFPDLDKVQSMILNDFGTAGHISSIPEFKTFCTKNRIEGISDTYYMAFSSRLDQKLFTE